MIREISSEEYGSLYGEECGVRGGHVYSGRVFTELNRGKVDDVVYLSWGKCVGEDKLGIALGRSGGGVWRSPFSAPMGGFVSRGGVTAGDYAEAAEAVSEWAGRGNLRVTVGAPDVYGGMRGVWESVAWGGAIGVCHADVNHYRVLEFEAGSATAGFSRMARKGYRRGEREGLRFEVLGCRDEEVRRVYGVIESNRRAMGYPLRMSEGDVVRTARVMGWRVMTVTNTEGEDVAGAMVCPVSAGVAQVIYWGDTVAGRRARAMDFLAGKVMDWARGEGYGVLDIGPSSESGVVSGGLSRFKESVGCRCGLKLTFGAV